MLKKLGKSQRGFTLVEVMAVLVILTISLGAISQALISGLTLTNKSSDQLDLRMSSRQIVTQMEKDIQAAASVTLDYNGSVQSIILLQSDGQTETMRYEYDPNTKTIQLKVKNGPTKVLARNIKSVIFSKESNATSVPTNGNYPGVSKVFVMASLGTRLETLDVQTNVSPRWNAGNDVAAIEAVVPSHYIFGQSQYTIDTILGKNTHWNTNSVVTLRDAGKIYAKSASGFTVSDSDGGVHQTLNNVTVATLDGQKLPFGFYDLYVETPMTGGGTEVVYAYSVFTCAWDPTQWVPSEGTWNSSGFNPRNFPYVKKDANNNDKVDYFKAFNIKNYTTKVSLQNYYSKGMDTSFTNTADSEIALWARKPSGGAKYNTYVGFGINKDSVFLRQVEGGVEVKCLKIPFSIDNDPTTLRSWAVLQATSENGMLHLWVNGTSIDSLVDAQDPSMRIWPSTLNGYLGVVVPNVNVQTDFMILRM